MASNWLRIGLDDGLQRRFCSRMQGRYFKESGSETVVVMSLIEPGLISNKELSKDCRACQLCEWPRRRLTNKGAFVVEQGDKPGHICGVGLFVEPGCCRDALIDIFGVQPRHEVTPGLIVHK